MQRHEKENTSAAREFAITRAGICSVSYIAAHCWNVSREAIERFPCEGNKEQLARMVAVALSRDLLLPTLERLAHHFGSDAEAMAACCNRVAELAERDAKFRSTVEFLRGAATSLLGYDRA